MPNPWAEAGKALGQGLGAYALLLQRDEHQQRRINQENKRMANADARWKAQQAESKERFKIQQANIESQQKAADKRHNDNVTMQEKRLEVDENYKGQMLSQRETDKALSMYNGYQKAGIEASEEIIAAANKRIEETGATGAEAQQIQIQAAKNAAAVQAKYESAREPYKQKLISAGYLPADVKLEDAPKPEPKIQEEGIPLLPGNLAKAPPRLNKALPGRGDLDVASLIDNNQAMINEEKKPSNYQKESGYDTLNRWSGNAADATMGFLGTTPIDTPQTLFNRPGKGLL